MRVNERASVLVPFSPEALETDAYYQEIIDYEADRAIRKLIFQVGQLHPDVENGLVDVHPPVQDLFTNPDGTELPSMRYDIEFSWWEEDAV